MDKDINIKKEAKINILMLIPILIIIAVIAGVSYAFYLITGQNDDITAGAKCYTVNYIKGQDITGELTLGSNYTSGRSTDIVMYSLPNCDLMKGTLYITTNEESTMDLTDQALKYTVVVNDTVVSEGSVDGSTNQVIYSDFTLNTTATTYKVYVWLDEALEDASNFDTESYSGFIHAEAVLESQVGKLTNPDIVLTNFTVDGSSTTTFPTTGTYTVEPNCTNATTLYDYTTKKIIISNISTKNRINCSPTLTTTTRTPLANYIINLLGSNTSVASTSNSDGSTLEKINSSLDTGSTSTDYRYRGINPNNYIWFNDELWRIIGVFDEYSHGQTGQNLVKIIRNDSIGGYVWDNNGSNGSNNFPDSDIYNLLNTAYYNSINGTDADYCYSNTTSLPGKCDFTYGGIKDSYRSMIKNVTWYLGGYSSYSVTSANMYKYERSTDTSSTYYYSGNAQTITNTPIGLMYVSDYGYAAPSTCTSNIGGYNASGCADKDWLKSNYYEWTITHNPSDSYGVFYVNPAGNVNNSNANSGYATRPVLYLDSSVYYISGDGSKINPYIIGM